MFLEYHHLQNHLLIAVNSDSHVVVFVLYQSPRQFTVISYNRIMFTKEIVKKFSFLTFMISFSWCISGGIQEFFYCSKRYSELINKSLGCSQDLIIYQKSVILLFHKFSCLCPSVHLSVYLSVCLTVHLLHLFLRIGSLLFC